MWLTAAASTSSPIEVPDGLWAVMIAMAAIVLPLLSVVRSKRAPDLVLGFFYLLSGVAALMVAAVATTVWEDLQAAAFMGAFGAILATLGVAVGARPRAAQRRSAAPRARYRRPDRWDRFLADLERWEFQRRQAPYDWDDSDSYER